MLGLKWLPAIVLLTGSLGALGEEYKFDRALLVDHIAQHFPEQLTNPQKKNRMSFANFGYGMYYVPVPIYEITEFINPHDFGPQSYSVPAKTEHNGSLYTCRGGFIDFSHLRAAVDWSTYLTFTILTNGKDFDLPFESGTLKVHLKNLQELTVEDIANMAQKIAFERLLWHETASWHYHAPNHMVNEQLSAFTPEDMYSNFLGTLIGKNVVLKILNDRETRTYSEIATEEIKKMIDSLDPMTEVDDSKAAYDRVDRAKQLKLSEAERNHDVWFDSDMILFDYRYVFKRNMHIGPDMIPWTVPHFEKCADAKPAVLPVPQKAVNGKSLYDYYDFRITPDEKLLFINKYNGKRMHPGFGEFLTKDFQGIIDQVKKDMEKDLGPGLDVRDSKDPIPTLPHPMRMWIKKRK